LYFYINTHHDEYYIHDNSDSNLAGETFGLFKFTNAGKIESLNVFKRIWEQIADNFKNYNEKVIFEGLNEPRTMYTPYKWTGGNAEERGVINEHYQTFVDTVRASGGNNDKRILMVNTYGASGLDAAINGLVIPADIVQNKIIVSIHSYEPFNFCYPEDQLPDSTASWSSSNSGQTSLITSPIDNAYNKFVSQGIPVIIGEFAAADKKQ